MRLLVLGLTACAVAACGVEQPETVATSNSALVATWSSFVPVRSARAFDSRAGRPIGPAAETCVKMSGENGVPEDASAVVLNVTATEPTSAGYLTVFPGGQPRPTSSNVNFVGGASVANAAVVPLGEDGKLCVFNSSGTTHVILDVSGYTKPNRDGLLFNATPPSRLLDTRDGARPSPGALRRVAVAGATLSNGARVPSEARMAIVNLTATDVTGAGFVTAYAASDERPKTSSLNVSTGETRANLAFVSLDASGAFSLYSTASAHLIADVVGYLRNDVGGAYLPIVPHRTYDSRNERAGTIGAGETRKIPMTGGATGVSVGGAVLANITAVDPTSAGFFTAGAASPVASTLNFARGATVPNLAATWVTSDGEGYVYNHSGRVHVVVDVLGVFSSPPNASPPVIAPPPASTALADVLRRLADEVPQRTPGTEASMAVLDLSTGEYAGVLDDEPRVSASSAKAIWVAGALAAAGIDAVAPFAEPIFRSSDNYASGSAIDLVGMNAMNEFYRRAGMTNSAILSWSYGASRTATNAPLVHGYNNYFTARDITTFLKGVASDTLLPAAENAQLKAWMRLSPRAGGVAASIGTLLPPSIRDGVMHKAGWLPPGSATSAAAMNTLNEIAIVPLPDGRAYAIAILLHGGADYYGAQLPFLEHASCVVYSEVSKDTGTDCQ